MEQTAHPVRSAMRSDVIKLFMVFNIRDWCTYMIDIISWSPQLILVDKDKKDVGMRKFPFLKVDHMWPTLWQALNYVV